MDIFTQGSESMRKSTEEVCQCLKVVFVLLQQMELPDFWSDQGMGWSSLSSKEEVFQQTKGGKSFLAIHTYEGITQYPVLLYACDSS